MSYNILTNKDDSFTYFNINFEGKRYFIQVNNKKLILAKLTENDIKDFIINFLMEG